MDFYGTASTAVGQLIKVTIFIKGVITDIKEFEDVLHDVQLKLNIQLATLEFFRRRFVDSTNGLMLPGRSSDFLVQTIVDLLLTMSGKLAVYEAFMRKYNFINEDEGEEALPEKKETKLTFLEKARTTFKTLKLKGYDWAIFDKKKLLAVLADYKADTDSLRGMMQHFSQEAIYNMVEGNSLQGTGLEPVIKRQKLAAIEPPADFAEIDGELVEEGAAVNRFKLGRWVHHGESAQVIVEHHEYEDQLREDDLDEEEVIKLKEPVKKLAWLLQNSSFRETDGAPNEEQPIIYSLQCLGYKDEAKEKRMTFLYKLPPPSDGTSWRFDSGNTLTTLHGLITKVDKKTKRAFKPPLADRFSIANSLALTVLNVHGSLWIHKNIWSHGILLFLQDKSGGTYPVGAAIERSGPAPTAGVKGEEKPQLLAFLGDWGYSRRIDGFTDMNVDFDIEANLYRHPERQGKPKRQFSRIHDIYALGVVLLEIGLWRTVSQLFDKQINEVRQTAETKLLKAKDVTTTLTSLARKELPKEMGERYASAVLACLTGDFHKDSDVELSLDMKEKVVDVTALGAHL
ncbi:hypothetical protein TARUN_7270 [Trichoderma arundinaceum]|uniref:Protein kinase domain-containing protein n=1 Tax=Trichoderma arundinaceum TaxID=490622 RepID=A0A395NFT8_TRIAR|nr:hypothetical protein TARUN_7270 [Trichoderma arundinaceum]